MLKKILFFLCLFITTNVIAQENSFFNKTYSNSNANLEIGVGYLFNPSMIKYQVASRSILLNKKLGFMYTIESNSDEVQDVFGLNYRISNSLSLQVGSGLLNYNVFNSGGIRKEISIAYHPDYMPLTITTGYSTSMGPSLGISYRIFFKKKKDEEKVKSNDKISKLNKEVSYDKLKNTSNTKKSTSIVESNQKTQTSKEISKSTTSNSNLEKVIKKPIQQKAVQKEIKKPTINTNKLCDESKVLYLLNMYQLSISEKKNLLKLSEYLKLNPKSKLTIFGSADKSGSEEYNLKLSARRANSSKNYLIKLGVSGKQLEVIALGESKSQNKNSKQERAKARSTTFKITTN